MPPGISMSRLNVSLTERQFTLVRGNAKAFGITYPDALRRILDEYIDLTEIGDELDRQDEEETEN